MIIFSNKIDDIRDQLNRYYISTEGGSFFKLKVKTWDSIATPTINNSKANLSVIPLDESKNEHLATVGKNSPCYHALIKGIKTTLFLDPHAKVVCSGIEFTNKTFDDKTAPNGLKSLIGCQKEAKDIQNKLTKEIAELTALNLKKNKNPKPLSQTKIKYDSVVVDYPGDYPPVPGEIKKIQSVGSSTYSRSVHGAVYNFYALEEMSLEEDKLPACFAERRKEFIDSTTRTMFDYLAMICLTECRHSFGTTWNIYGNTNTYSRNAAWTNGVNYNPRQFLKVCEYLFENTKFPGGYGGASWAKIAHCALRYFDLPPITWFDHVVDLAHNGGLAFNKGIFWHCPGNSDLYIKMLDRRKTGSIFDDFDGRYVDFTSCIGELRWIPYCLGFTDKPGPKYPPIDWGSALVVCQTNQEIHVTTDNDDEEIEVKQRGSKRIV